MVEDKRETVGRVKHYIITRINTHNTNGTNTDPAWASDRTRLLAEHTVKSLSRQNDQRFEWVTVFDIDTPDGVFDDALKICENFGARIVWLRGKFDSTVLSETLSAWEDEDDSPDWIITTRLDSDDILCDNFVELVRAEFDLGHHGRNRLDIELPNGVLYWERDGVACADERLSRQFITCAEKPEKNKAIETCYGKEGQGFKRVLRTRAAWCKIIHSSNGIYKQAPDRMSIRVSADILKDRFKIGETDGRNIDGLEEHTAS